MEKNETKKCKKCMEDINKKAKRCPKCGANLGVPGWIKVLIILGVVFFMCIACMAGCVNSVNDTIDEIEQGFNDTIDEVEQGVNDTIDEVEQKLKDEYSDKNGKKIFKIGDSFENQHLKLSVTEINNDWKEYNSYLAPSSGKKIIKVALNAENIGNDSYDISFLYFRCYADDVKVEQYIWAEDSSEFGGTISPGKKTVGALYYEVPLNAQKLVLEYSPNILNSEYIIQFELN